MTTDESTRNATRRTILNAVAAGTSALALSGTATASDGEVDSPDGFGVDVLAGHATFANDVAAKFGLTYDGGGRTRVVNPTDASTVVVAEATWQEHASSGWHLHPGPYIVNMVEGAIEVTDEHDCAPRVYSAGDAWLETGDVHVATSDGGARGYVTFLGIPDGEPATEWVEPVEC